MRIQWKKDPEPVEPVPVAIGVWVPLDGLTPEQVAEDTPFLADPSRYAYNVVLPSGRTWKWKPLP